MTTTNAKTTGGKNKATHSGTCQICGATQKLPYGLLSKHGYNVKWGFFSGVCGGADHQPFEVSCNLIESAILTAESRIEADLARIEELRGATGDRAWVNYYQSDPSGRNSGYRWVECEVVSRHIVVPSTGYEYDKVVYVGPDGKDHDTGSYPAEKTVSDAVAKLNASYIERVLQRRIGELRQYIAWQRERVASWQPGELKPIKTGK